MGTKKLLSGAGAITGYIVGIIGLTLAIFTINGKIEIDWKWLVFIGVIVMFIIIVAIISFLNCRKALIESKRYQVHSYDRSEEKDYFYIMFSKLFRYDALVSIYIIIDGISKRMGFGLVSNVSDDEYIEIEVVKIFEGYEDKFREASSNNKKTLDKMYIMPTVYNENIQCIYSAMAKRSENCGQK